jgi:integrase
LFVLVFNTGLRRGSLFSLRTDDGDWQRSTIKIPGKRMKTGKEHRLPLNDVVIAHLRAIKRDRKLLLPLPHCGSWFDKNFHRLQTACGIPRAEHVGLHQLRERT